MVVALDVILCANVPLRNCTHSPLNIHESTKVHQERNTIKAGGTYKHRIVLHIRLDCQSKCKTVVTKNTVIN